MRRVLRNWKDREFDITRNVFESIELTMEGGFKITSHLIIYDDAGWRNGIRNHDWKFWNKERIFCRHQIDRSSLIVNID